MSNWEGTVVDNRNVAATIRKEGPPVHSKPHGPGKTILYYEGEASEREHRETEDFAGTKTPGGRSRVQHSAGPGVETTTAVDARLIAAGVSGRGRGSSWYGAHENPNDLARDAEITNSEELEDEVVEEEEKKKEGEDPRPEPDASLSELSELSDTTPPGETPSAGKASEEKKGDRSYESLDALTVAELEAVYEKNKDSVGEIKGSGAGGNVLKADYINALRTDK